MGREGLLPDQAPFVEGVRERGGPRKLFLSLPYLRPGGASELEKRWASRRTLETARSSHSNEYLSTRQESSSSLTHRMLSVPFFFSYLALTL